MSLKKIPSEEILRQRLNAMPKTYQEIFFEESIRMLQRTNMKASTCIRDLVPLDIDVSPFDNSGSKKEGVSRTYKQSVDGYAPIMAYLGKKEGWCVAAELREGSRHSNCDKGAFVSRAIHISKKMASKLLVRMDSAHDSLDVLKIVSENKETKSDFIIKRNLRKEDPSDYIERLKKSKTVRITQPREGKTVYVDKIRADMGLKDEIYMVIEATERTIDKHGNPNLIPDLKVNSFWTSLNETAEEIIRLYHDHGTSEQFHSEIKSDIGLERFPSGKFQTNALVLSIACMAYNILTTSKGYNGGLSGRKGKYRYRLKTVIQDIMYLASRAC